MVGLTNIVASVCTNNMLALDHELERQRIVYSEFWPIHLVESVGLTLYPVWQLHVKCPGALWQ